MTDTAELKLPFDVMNTEDLRVDNPSILIVGDSGTGKTSFLGSIPRVFIWDFDKGMASVRDKPISYLTFKDAPPGVKENQKEGIYSYGTAYDAFLLRLNKFGAMIEKEGFPYDVIGIDSLTTLSSIIMNNVLRADGKPGNQPAIQHWGRQMSVLESLVDQLTAWPLPVVMTAHIQRNTNDLTAVIEQLPLLTGKLAGKISIFFDEVWYSQVNGGGDKRRYTLQTASSGMIKQARSRFGVPDGIETSWEKVVPYFK